MVVLPLMLLATKTALTSRSKEKNSMLNTTNTLASSGGIAVNASGNNNTFNVGSVGRATSILSPLLDKIIDSYDSLVDESNKPNSLPTPDEKLDFNAVSVFKSNIREAVSFLALVEEAIFVNEEENPGYTNRIQKAIYQKYTKYKSNLLIDNKVSPDDKDAVISLIRGNSDGIIRDISSHIYNEFTATHMCGKFSEDIEMCVKFIVCYGFINCKILERPDDYK